MLVVDWLAAAQSCCKASRFAAKLRGRVRSEVSTRRATSGRAQHHVNEGTDETKLRSRCKRC